VAAIVGSFVVQTHVGYAPLVLPLVSLAIAWSFVSAWRGRVGTERRELASRAGRVLAITTGIVALLWSPPLVEEVRHSPGNLASVVDYFRRGGDLHSLTDGFRVLAAQFTVTPDWVTGATHTSPFTGETGLLTSSPLPVLVVPLAAAAGLLRAWRCGPALRLLVLVVVAVILGVLAVARTIGYVFAYRLGWSWVLGMVAAIVVGWAMWLLFERRTAVGTGRIRTVVLLALGAITAVNVTTAAGAGTPQEPESSRLGHLVRSVVDALPESDGDVVVKSEGFPANWYGWGLLLGLERRGVAARYTRQEGVVDLLGRHRVHRRGPVRAVLTIASDEQVDALAGRRDVRLVAYTGDLSPRRRADEVRRLSALDRQHEDGTIDDVEYFIERGELVRRLGTAVGVFSQVRR
jgi:hypothetical protein